MLSDPEVVREVYRADPEVLHSGEANGLFAATVGQDSGLPQPVRSMGDRKPCSSPRA
jgi:hypothetical protein